MHTRPVLHPVIRSLVLVGGLFVMLAPAGARAGAPAGRLRLRCLGAANLRCYRIAEAAPAASAGDAAAAFARRAPITAAIAAGGFHSGHSPDAPPVFAGAANSAAANPDRDFSPGQSTAEGQHVVEWTLLAAPFAAYALSPVIDHRLHHVDSGIWTRKYQLDFEYAVILGEVGGALWTGGESRLGKTFWRSVDASFYTAVTVQAMKYAFSRARPYQSASPDRWFQGNCCQSFPSGEVSFQASVVTPFIAEYHGQHPWIWALEALPAYDALARMKAQGHWQTDVLAAWAIGTAWGLYAHYEPNPLILSVMPNGIMVGLHAHF